MTVRQLTAILSILLLLSINSCKESDATYDFPQSPYIQLPLLNYEEIIEPGLPDTLFLQFEIYDQEGDLGIDRDESDYPFHEFDPVFDSQDRWVTYGRDDVNPPFFILDSSAEKQKISDTDNRPAFSCENYMEASFNEDYSSLSEPFTSYFSSSSEPWVTDDLSLHRDTLYVLKNENRYNILVEFYRLDRGNEALIPWKYLTSQYGCGINFDGRFPFVGNLNTLETQQLEGSPFSITRISRFGYQLQYAMVSTGFRIVFRKDKIKVRITIKDREINESNVLETEYMTLDEMMSVN